MSHGTRKRPSFLPLSMGLIALAVLWSCDGQNFFAPVASFSEGSAPVVEIQQPRAPAARPVGDSVLVVARASDDVGVDSMLFAGVSFRGDESLGTDTIVSRYFAKMVRFDQAIPDTTVSRYLVASPDSTRETSVLFAIAYDSNGNLSADTVPMTIGGPRVTFLTLEDDQQVQAGLSLNLQVEAADPEGILDLTLEVEGAFESLIEIPFNPPLDSVRVDTAVVLPAGVTGFIEVTATARNGLAIEGQDGPVTLEIVDREIGDETPPTVSVAASSTERLELDDPVTVLVSGADDSQGSGIARAGYTIRGISPRRGDTLTITDEKTFNPARTGNQAASFEFLPFNVDHLALPDTMVYEITGWAVDGDGNCAAAVESETPMSLPCGAFTGGETAAEDRSGFNLVRVMTSGKTVGLPRGGRIMDAVVDTLRRNLLLTNMEKGLVEVFRLEDQAFGTAINVGSAPWGLTLDRSGDELLVANSGGTNISVIDLTLEQKVDDRFFAPDAVIFDLELEEGDGGLRYRVYPFPAPDPPSFSDRPQFIAVDSFGNIIYSTRTTSVGDIGTARKAYFPEGADRSETKLFVEHSANFQSKDFWAFAHIDSIGVGVDSVGVGLSGNPLYAAGLTLFDHVPGFPDSIIQATQSTLDGAPTENAYENLVAKGSDAYMEVGVRWNIPSFGFADTTFVTASGDGGWVLIGEGGTEELGRVMMYRASQRDTTDLSSTLRVWDELINVGDVVRGIGLNYDGTLGVARGRDTYFFDTELQLNGIVPGIGEGTGAALHPLHANQATLENGGGEYRPDTHLAFVGTGGGTVDIIDTWHFQRIGQVTLRDVITGPLRATLPFPGDNDGLTCSTLPVTDQVGNPIGDAVQLYQGGLFTQPLPPDGITEDDCVVVNLFAITSAEGVVVVPVRKSEILKYHDERREY